MSKFVRNTNEKITKVFNNVKHYFIDNHSVTNEIKILAKNKRVRILAVSMAMTLLFSILTINTQVCYAISINGESIGSAQNRLQIAEVIKEAEEQASEILGYDCSLTDNVSITAQLNAQADDVEALEEVILSNVEGITQMYAVIIDGEIVCAVSDEAQINSILNDFLDRYSTENTISVSFLQDISVEYTYVSENIVCNISEAESILDPINNSSEHRLSVLSTEIEKNTEEISYDTKYYNDDTMYEGDSQVTTVGVPGESLVTTCNYFVNGECTGSSKMAEEVVTEPVTECIAQGTAKRPPTASYGTYIWPTDGTLTSNFGYRSVSVGSSYHKGIDISGSHGQDILAADGGEVIYAGWMSGYGNFIEIRHDNGDVTCYGHCSSLLVEAGQRVAQGECIALMGSTGRSSGTHLHFEIRVDGTQVDPLEYLA